MQNKNILILQGGVATIGIYRDDETATSVQFLIKNDDTEVLQTITAAYVDGYAEIDITGANTATIGVYSYQINEVTPDGLVKHGAYDCDGDGDCDFGHVIICESLDGAVS